MSWSTAESKHFNHSAVANVKRRTMRQTLGFVVACLFLLLSAAASSEELPIDYLTRDSVVLITGAAGFIGSELAMALHRTYRPKKIILIDAMHSTDNNAASTEQELALLEFKRQRVFHVLQTLGTSAHFYRVDFRPNIPEFLEAGEVPMLHHIFNLHSDITHVVHLADVHHENKDESLEQAVPRLAESPKAGMMEALLEELRFAKSDRHQRSPPHFVYASSHEVYNFRSTEPPFDEGLPLSTPSSLAGASKLMDEVLAQAYFETDGVFSIGLRFFQVYGPWGVPGSPVFELAERAVLKQQQQNLELPDLDDIRDYIYIDDAVDAIMTSMQLRLPEPVVVNVGTGHPTTLRHLGALIAKETGDEGSMMEEKGRDPKTRSFASTKRAEALLGFQQRVSLEQGVEQLVSWHLDRAFPYGSSTSTSTDKSGMAACEAYDSECLKGSPVFPCASECSHPTQCTTSFFDDVLPLSKRITKDCLTVLYTVVLDSDLTDIPSALVEVSMSSQSHVENVGESKCNVAFVSDGSPLVRRLLLASSSGGSTPASAGTLVHGFWTLVPVTMSKSVDMMQILSLVPKLSPGLFFEGPQRAIYVAPNVILDSIPQVLTELNKIPPETSAGKAATAFMLGKATSTFDTIGNTQHLRSMRTMVQDSAYRMIRIAAIHEMATESFSQHVATDWMVHLLNQSDARLFRCDVLQEVVQWDVASDQSALEFILGLHDMWSRVIAKKRNDKWATSSTSNEQTHVQDKTPAEKKKPHKKEDPKKEVKENEGGVEDNSQNEKSGDKNQQDFDLSVKSADETTEDDEVEEEEAENSPELDIVTEDEPDEKRPDPVVSKESAPIRVEKSERVQRRLEEEEEEEDEMEESEDGSLISGWGQEHNAFGMPEAIQDAVRAVFGDAVAKPEDDDFSVDDDDGFDDKSSVERVPDYRNKGEAQEDQSAADSNGPVGESRQAAPDDSDIWMGVLSSTDTQYFARIVSSGTVGAIRLDEYERSA